LIVALEGKGKSPIESWEGHTVANIDAPITALYIFLKRIIIKYEKERLPGCHIAIISV